MSNLELAEKSNVPVYEVGYLKMSFAPKEYWRIQKRLAPEREELMPAWDILENGEIPRSDITKTGIKRYVEELARFNYITLKRVQHYPKKEPNWEALREKRDTALMNLAEVRLLVESLPDHLAE